LIAAKEALFFDGNWEFLGNKAHLAQSISTITSIDIGLLKGERSFKSYSCAQKMSWAAHRKTGRVEDRAYSLLGLFDISMPVIYGEGWKPFERYKGR
jgi:hypothetical protein